MKIMASGSITTWEINGETVKTVLDFIFLGSKITADGDYFRNLSKNLTSKGKEEQRWHISKTLKNIAVRIS